MILSPRRTFRLSAARQRASACVAACLLVAAVPVAAGDQLRLATGSGYAPYSDEALPGGGMLTALVRRVMELGGYDARIEWLPWKRGYELTRLGHYDATFPYARTPEREAEYLYSDLLYGGERAIYVRRGESVDPSNPGSMADKTYCLATGFVLYPRVETLVAQGRLRVERAPSLTSCAKMLALGRVDLFIADAVVGGRAVEAAAVDDRVIRMPKPFERGELYIIVPRSHSDGQELIDRINRALKTLKASGEYDRIIARSGRDASSRR